MHAGHPPQLSHAEQPSHAIKAPRAQFSHTGHWHLPSHPGTSSPMQSSPHTQHGSPGTKCLHPPSQGNGSSSPRQSASPPTQGTSHPPSLLPDRGHPCCYTNGSNFPFTNDAAKRTISLQKAHGNFLQTSATMLTTGLCNSTNITGRTNTAVTPLITASPTSKSAYRPPANLVTTPVKEANAVVYPSSYSGNFTGSLITVPSVVSGSAALLALKGHGNTPRDHRGAEIAITGCILAGSHPNSCRQWGCGFSTLVEARDVG